MRRSNLNNYILILWVVWLISACSLVSPRTLPVVQEGTLISPSPTLPTTVTASTETLTPTALLPRISLTPVMTPSGVPDTPSSPPPPITPTPDPYAGLSIEDLTARAYGGGELENKETLAVNSYFTRTLITYPSDGLAIYGFMNTPGKRALDGVNPSDQNQRRLPVIIAIHGYIDPAIYRTLDYTTRYADALARSGFLVIHPNLRGYPPSDEGDNLFRVGMAIDVLNLIAIIREQSGKPGPLENADPDAIGLWGHSMGGGIAIRVITIDPGVRAAVLYGAMSSDDKLNYERIFSYFSNGTRGLEELQAPPDLFERVSPINFLERIQSAVSIHHGSADVDVPPAWSTDLCQRLRDLGKVVECFAYSNQPHTFHGGGDASFIQRTIEFFDRELRGR